MPPLRRPISTYTAAPDPQVSSPRTASSCRTYAPSTSIAGRRRAQTQTHTSSSSASLVAAEAITSSSKPQVQPVRARARTISEVDVDSRGSCKKGRYTHTFSLTLASASTSAVPHISTAAGPSRKPASPSTTHPTLGLKSPSTSGRTYMTRSRTVSARPRHSASSASHRQLNIASNHIPNSGRTGISLSTAAARGRSTNNRLVIDITPLDLWQESQIPSPSFSPSLDTETDVMSFLSPATNYLAAKVEVVFEQDGRVEMVGSPNTGTSYSLPGHVLLTLPALPRNIQGRRREIRDLSLQMESMSDYFDEHGRYTPFRIHDSTTALALDALILPSINISRPTESRVQVTIPFDLRLPGWLPSSHASRMTNVCHGVVARASIGWEAVPSASVGVSGVCVGVTALSNPPSYSLSSSPANEAARRTSTRKSRLDSFFVNASLTARTAATSSSKYTPLTIFRHRLPSSIITRLNDRTFTVQPEMDAHSPAECIIICPEWVDLNSGERNIRLAIRLRAKPVVRSGRSSRSSSRDSEVSSGSSSSSLAAPSTAPICSTPMVRSKGAGGEAVTAHLLELGMEVEEIERFNSQPITAWSQAFPVPKNQPNRAGTMHPLISPRSPWADVGVVLHNDARPFRAITTRQCLLGDDGKQRSFSFAGDGLALNDRWRKVNVLLPMPELELGRDKVKNNRPRSEVDSPFLRVRHNLKIKLVCRDAQGGEMNDVLLTVPIRFGTQPSTYPSSTTSPAAQLPAYVQIFHENGDLRECDPLPIYSKDDAPVGEMQIDSPAPSPANSPPLPPKPRSAGVAPLAPLAARRAATPPTTRDVPMDDDYPMSDSSDSEAESGSDAESESESDSESASSGSGISSSSSTSASSRTSISSSQHEQDLDAEISRLMSERLERDYERQKERERDRQRRMDIQRERENEREAQMLGRERERETRSQAPPPTPLLPPRTPGAPQHQTGRKPVRAVGTPRSARPVA